MIFNCLFLCFTPRKLVEFSFVIGKKSQRESGWSVCMAVFRSIRGVLEVVLTSVSLTPRVILRLNLSGLGLLYCARIIKKTVLEVVVNTLWLMLNLARHLTKVYTAYRSQENSTIPIGSPLTIYSENLPDSFLFWLQNLGQH